MMRKKLLALLLSVLMIFSFNACSDLLPSYHAKKEAKNYFNYLKNKDIKKLTRLFSDDVNETHDLEKEWDEFFSCIDGNIVSYEKISSGGEEEYIDHGKTTYYTIVINFVNVETDTGKTYEYISFSQTRANKKHPENKGINLFSIRLPADNDKGFEEKIVGEIMIYPDK